MLPAQRERGHERGAARAATGGKAAGGRAAPGPVGVGCGRAPVHLLHISPGPAAVRARAGAPQDPGLARAAPARGPRLRAKGAFPPPAAAASSLAARLFLTPMDVLAESCRLLSCSARLE